MKKISKSHILACFCFVLACTSSLIIFLGTRGSLTRLDNLHHLSKEIVLDSHKSKTSGNTDEQPKLSYKSCERDKFKNITDMNNYQYQYNSVKGTAFQPDNNGKQQLHEFLNSRPVSSEEVQKFLQAKYLPQLVTAASSNHFQESLGLLKSIANKLGPSFPLIYYDLGLAASELTKLEKTARDMEMQVVVRPFPFARYPSHVKKLFNYAWKIFLIAEMLMQFPVIIYMDTSVRFDYNFTDVSVHVKRMYVEQGLSFSFCIPPPGHSIGAATFGPTMSYLSADVYRMKQTLCGSATCMSLAHTFDVHWLVLRWALLCALTEDCIASDRMNALHCPKEVYNFVSAVSVCHRYDQSVFSILVSQCWGFDAHNFNFLSQIAHPERG